MKDGENVSEIQIDDQKIIENNELSIWEALIPVFALIGMLAYNVFVFGDDALSGSNQFILILGGAVAAIVGFRNKISYKQKIKLDPINKTLNTDLKPSLNKNLKIP